MVSPGNSSAVGGVRTGNFYDKRTRDRASRMRRLLAADPGYKFREPLRPAVWDETVLTERWEDRKARLTRERGA
jgi:hypothetical protein